MVTLVTGGAAWDALKQESLPQSKTALARLGPDPLRSVVEVAQWMGPTLPD